MGPWGRAYGLAYNSTERIMILYSAGRNGMLETKKGEYTVSGKDDISTNSADPNTI